MIDNGSKGKELFGVMFSPAHESSMTRDGTGKKKIISTVIKPVWGGPEMRMCLITRVGISRCTLDQGFAVC